MEPHSTFFTTKNGSKIVLCANNCRPQMELFCTIETFFVPQSDSIPHFMFQGSHMSQEGLKQVSHPLIFEYWARDSDLGFRSQRLRGRVISRRATAPLACGCPRVRPVSRPRAARAPCLAAPCRATHKLVQCQGRRDPGCRSGSRLLRRPVPAGGRSRQQLCALPKSPWQQTSVQHDEAHEEAAGNDGACAQGEEVRVRGGVMAGQRTQ